MDIKNSLKKITDKIIKNKDSKSNFDVLSTLSINEYDLNNKVDNFIYWYLENIVKHTINKNSLNSQIKKLRDFIEKNSGMV